MVKVVKCETCDNVFDYVPEKRFCNKCTGIRKFHETIKSRNYRKQTREEAVKNYKEKHEKRINAKARKYRKENREKANAYQRKYRKENAEKIREYRRKYYAENREKAKAYQRKYNEENREKVYARHRKYREKNREERAAYQRKYRDENREKLKAQRHKYYKEKRKNDPEWYTEQKKAIARRNRTRYEERKAKKEAKKGLTDIELLMDKILKKELTICETCDTIFKYVPQKRFCGVCRESTAKRIVRCLLRNNASITKRIVRKFVRIERRMTASTTRRIVRIYSHINASTAKRIVRR